MKNASNSIFRAFVREIIQQKNIDYTNKKGVIQSSVGMIFKLYTDTKLTNTHDALSTNYDNIELLFTQRAGYEKDRNAYNIVFPGGQCDQQQTDLQACKRELHEQIGLKVDEQCVYIGQLPKNFYYLQKRGSKVYISCHIWFMKQEELSWKETLNSDELRDSKWVSFHDLLSQGNYVEERSLKPGLIERMAMKYNFQFVKNLKNNIIAFIIPQLKLGMDRNLWGLTLWIWSFALQMSLKNLLDQKSPQKVQNSQLFQMKSYIQHIKKVEVQFIDNYLLKYPILGGIKYWHIMNRVRPFTYERPSQSKAKLFLVCIFVVLMIVYSIID